MGLSGAAPLHRPDRPRPNRPRSPGGAPRAGSILTHPRDRPGPDLRHEDAIDVPLARPGAATPTCGVWSCAAALEAARRVMVVMAWLRAGSGPDQGAGHGIPPRRWQSRWHDGIVGAEDPPPRASAGGRPRPRPTRCRVTVRLLICRCRAIALIDQPRACSAFASTYGSHASTRQAIRRGSYRIGGNRTVEGLTHLRWCSAPSEGRARRSFRFVHRLQRDVVEARHDASSLRRRAFAAGHQGHQPNPAGTRCGSAAVRRVRPTDGGDPGRGGLTGCAPIRPGTRRGSSVVVASRGPRRW